MRTSIIIAALLNMLFFGYAHIVQAHKLGIDGTIGVTVHITPNDEPLAGQEAEIFVDINDPSGGFQPDDPGACTCLLRIQQLDAPDVTLQIVADGRYPRLLHIFPRGGEAILTVTGEAAVAGDATFQPFRSSFTFFVRSAPGAPAAPKHGGSVRIILLGVGIGGGTIAFYLLFWPKKRANQDGV